MTLNLISAGRCAVGLILFLSNLSQGVVSDYHVSDRYNGYSPVWSDNFAGNSLNEDIWSCEEGYVRNDELQYYTGSDKNVYVSDGMLHLAAYRETITDENGKEYNYSSGSVHTKDKLSFREGILEMRAKLPKGKGMWPAFWTLGAVSEDKEEKYPQSWPYAGEIDIMEMVGGEAQWGEGGDAKIYANIQWGNPPFGDVFSLTNVNGHNYTCEKGIFNDNFHVFGIKWTQEEITWFCDDNDYYTIEITDDMTCFKELDQYILINLAVGGEWAGEPDEKTIFPNEYVIDWVRIYQKEENINFYK